MCYLLVKNQKKNELDEAEIISEEKEYFPIDSVKPLSQKDTVDTLNNRKLIDVILTRNVKDYKNSELPVMTPETYLKASLIDPNA